MDKINTIYIIENNHVHENVNDNYLFTKNVNINGNYIQTIYCSICHIYMCQSVLYENIYKYKFKDILFKRKNDTLYINNNVKNNSVSKVNNKIEFFIKTSNFKCINKNHNIEPIKALVKVFNIRSEIFKELEVNAFYCNTCHLYYIYEIDYNYLLKDGIPVCPVYDEVKYFSSKTDFDDFKSESLLRQFGYNVNANENLTRFERQNIIEKLVKNNILSKDYIMTHLNYLISTRKDNYRMRIAVSKWKEDIEFTRNLIQSTNRKVEVGAIRHTVYKTR